MSKDRDSQKAAAGSAPPSPAHRSTDDVLVMLHDVETFLGHPLVGAYRELAIALLMIIEQRAPRARRD